MRPNRGLDHQPPRAGAIRSQAFVRAVALALLALLLGGCGGDQSAERARTGEARQAIVILLDAARRDRLSCYGYERQTTPNLDRLAAGGLLGRYHVAQATDTRASLPNMLYSRYFAVPLFPASPSMPLTEPKNLFRRPDDACASFVQVLRDEGFLTATVSAHPWIKAGTRFADEFDELYDLANVLQDGEVYPNAEAIVDTTLVWLDRHRDEDFLLYLHLMDTHLPHSFGPDAQAYFGAEPYTGDRFNWDGAPKDPRRPLNATDRRYLNALYDGSMLYTDRELGRIFAHLEEAGRLESTVIVLTADHGEQLLEVPGRFGHQGPWYELAARIPFIVHAPRRLAAAGLAGTEVRSPTEMVDLMPTLLSLLEVPLPAGKECDGVDLLQVAAGSVPPRSNVLARGGLRDVRWKLIVDAPDREVLGAEAPDPSSLSGQLYDLHGDPGETRDLWQEKPGEVGRLLGLYRQEMMPRWLRFTSAITLAQPRVPFAIGTNDFRLGAALPALARRPRGEDCASAGGAKPVWLRSEHAHKFWLMAQPGADALEVEFAVPSGRYVLTAKAMGQGELWLPGAEEPLPVVGTIFDPEAYADPGTVEIGPVTVTDELFRCHLRSAASGSCFYLRMIGFTPVLSEGDEKIDTALDEERIRRLRSLGYVD